MNFAINYSTQAALLFSQGRLRIDRFKCPDWPELIAEAGQYRPIAVHFNLNAGRGKLRGKNLESIAHIAEETSTPFINLHLELKKGDFPAIPIDSTRQADREMFFRMALSDVEIAVRRFGDDKVIVENVPYRPNGKGLRLSVETETISRIVAETGCGFLLDIPHACISAHHLGLDPTEYISRLPVHRLKELHFTGVQDLGGWLQDHLEAQEKDWQMLDWVLKRIQEGAWPKPWLLALEYGGVGEKFSWRSSAQVIEEQGKRINTLIEAL